MAKKGRSGPNIGSHGTAITVNDINSSLSEPYDIASTFEPDPGPSESDGVGIYKFPLDDVSAGGFWTRLIINSWVPVIRNEKEPIVAGQNHSLDKDSLANIWLPMPLTLQTTYAQKYTESDNMMVNRGSTADLILRSGSDHLDQGAAVLAGAASEFADFASSMANINNSGKMAMGSVMNQMMGLVYDGASLRSHTLNWRMIPKDRAEQNAIETVCFAFKKFAAPVVKGIMGGDVNFENSAKAHKLSKIKIDETTKKATFTPIAAGSKEDVQDSLRSLGRLGIPVTVNVEFWFGASRNPHLFQIKDSFIESVEVLYTPTGAWNAYEDGAPIETQLNVTLKENAIVTANDIDQVGGY